ncbi:MHYT domain-containing protein [Acidisoma silvae]|uniref:HD domain-containing protein n=1 Tax=Acidisoma silvae TaxID=2802396 RepID=A0A964DZU5_9PROT|nr:MHYT domain-containing protein [Acidisoma silvae]MCB8876464.1 HD domain-containing protein [Acidisoma silvae]
MSLTFLGLCISTATGPHFVHDPGIVVLSYFVAVIGSYAALDMTERLNKASAPAVYLWLAGSALTLGGSMWSMHFIGILAVRATFPLNYDPVLTTISFAIAVLACAVGLELVRGAKLPNRLQYAGAGVTVGIGVAAMHYTGMAALQLPGTLSYQPGLFILSVVIGIGAATAAFWLSRNTRHNWQRAVAALVMAAAIAGMHYTGMAATVIHYGAETVGSASLERSPLTLAIAGVTIALLGLALVCNAADRGKAVAAQRETDILAASTREIVGRLCAAGEFRDDDTGHHVLRLARIASRLSELSGTDPAFSKLIMEAAPLHDIGKIGIPDSILLKADNLTEGERVRMRSHTDIGHTLLTGSGLPLLDFAAEIALTHHEKWDGSGYPRGLRGEAIPLAGRIVAIADVFDALLSPRAYKTAWSAVEVKALLARESGQHFDPELMTIFLAHFDEMLLVRGVTRTDGGFGDVPLVIENLRTASA